MSNNIKLPPIDATPFVIAIRTHLSSNLNDYLIKSLSSMLALDYVNRSSKLSEMEINDYARICCTRLKKHLKHTIVTEEDFSSVMSLFTIAITPEKTLDDESLNTREQEQDIYIDSMIAAHFPELSSTEKQNIKDALRGLINNPDSKEIINFIHSDPKLFYSLVFKAYKEKSKQKEIMESLTFHLTQIIQETKAVNKWANKVKDLTSKITLGIGLFTAASVGLLIGGLALPALLIPATAISIRLAPSVGNKIGAGLVRNNNKFQQRQKNLKTLITSILHPALDQEQSKDLSPKKSSFRGAQIDISPPEKGVKRLEATKKLAHHIKRER